jgi:hypothetical protein
MGCTVLTMLDNDGIRTSSTNGAMLDWKYFAPHPKWLPELHC